MSRLLMTKQRRKRWLKNRLRSQARVRTLRFNDAIDKLFKVGKYKTEVKRKL